MVKGPDGRPWHSWRVLILKNAPHTYSDLYDAYRFDEPWDGPHNAQLAGRIGEFYRRRGLNPNEPFHTSFVAVVGPETAWPGAESRSKKDIRDGPSNTILLVEMAESGIPWMKPEDLNFDRMTFQVNEGSGKGPGSKVSGARALLATGPRARAAGRLFAHDTPGDADDRRRRIGRSRSPIERRQGHR